MDELPNKLQMSVSGSSLAKKTFLLQNLEKLKGKSLMLTSLKLKVLSLKAQPKKFKDGAQPCVANR